MTDHDFFLHCLKDEHPRTRGVLAALNEAGLDYKPHEKSRTARELVGHMLGHFQDLVELADDGVINHRMEVPFEGVAAAVELFEGASVTLQEKAAGLDEETWSRTAQMKVGDHIAWEGPIGHMMWGFLFDMIHHRGQLSTYLRPMGGTVPAIYGPSADDDGEG